MKSRYIIIIISLCTLIFSKDFRTQINSINELIKNGKYDEGIKKYNQIEKNAPEKIKKVILWNKAIAYEKKKDYENAIKTWEEFLLYAKKSQVPAVTYSLAKDKYLLFKKFNSLKKLNLLLESANDFSNFIELAKNHLTKVNKVRIAYAQKYLKEISDYLKKLSEKLKKMNENQKKFQRFLNDLNALKNTINKNETQKSKKNLQDAKNILKTSSQYIAQHLKNKKEVQKELNDIKNKLGKIGKNITKSMNDKIKKETIQNINDILSKFELKGKKWAKNSSYKKENSKNYKNKKTNKKQNNSSSSEEKKALKEKKAMDKYFKQMKKEREKELMRKYGILPQQRTYIPVEKDW